MSIAVYGNRTAPRTTINQVEVLKELFTRKTVVTENDIHKATGKKWIRGFMHALSVTVEKVVPVKDGRRVIGYRFESKPLQVSSTGSVKIDGRFVKLASAAKTEPKAPKRVRKAKESVPEAMTVTSEAAPSVEAPALPDDVAAILS